MGISTQDLFGMVLKELGTYFKNWEKQPKYCHITGSIAATTPTQVLTLYHTIPTFNDPKEEGFVWENTVGKEENTGDHHFLLSPQCFLLYQTEKLSF